MTRAVRPGVTTSVTSVASDKPADDGDGERTLKLRRRRRSRMRAARGLRASRRWSSRWDETAGVPQRSGPARSGSPPAAPRCACSSSRMPFLTTRPTSKMRPVSDETSSGKPVSASARARRRSTAGRRRARRARAAATAAGAAARSARARSRSSAIVISSRRASLAEPPGHRSRARRHAAAERRRALAHRGLGAAEVAGLRRRRHHEHRA